ncbi:hypothetical protein LIER_37574 [Lithospermum erythrorhizon]|uniref:Uncharacterized protein n=1 Tax=Lithospermum erythrorhizon TaxID=34254 RepID=A0AAV3PMJ5_LITER
MEKLNSKILESVTDDFNNKVYAIEEANNISEIPTNELMENLMAAEMVVARIMARKKVKQIKPTLALKSTESLNESPTEDEDDKNDEIAMMAKYFSKYLKFKKNRGEFPSKFENTRMKDKKGGTPNGIQLIQEMKDMRSGISKGIQPPL